MEGGGKSLIVGSVVVEKRTMLTTTQNIYVFPIEQLDKTKNLPDNSTLQLLLEEFRCKQSFLDSLLSGELGSFAELAIGTQNEAWFHGLYHLRGSTSEESFDTFAKLSQKKS
jgi:hypothetical protein